MPSCILVSPAVWLVLMLVCSLLLVAVGGQQCVADSSVVLVNSAWDESSAASISLSGHCLMFASLGVPWTEAPLTVTSLSLGVRRSMFPADVNVRLGLYDGVSRLLLATTANVFLRANASDEQLLTLPLLAAVSVPAQAVLLVGVVADGDFVVRSADGASPSPLCSSPYDYYAAASMPPTAPVNGVASHVFAAITACTAEVSAVQIDPEFIGLRGQSFRAHVVDGGVYAIVSEENTQVNARFVFLTQGQCPLIDGVQAYNCWTHPGLYMGALSFQQVVDGVVHSVVVTAGNSAEGFASVCVDGQALSCGVGMEFAPSLSVNFTSSHAVFVQTEHFAFELSNSDGFINLSLRSLVALRALRSHGLLGQTHAAELYSSALRVVEGDAEDYAVEEGEMLSSSFAYSRFRPHPITVSASG